MFDYVGFVFSSFSLVFGYEIKRWKIYYEFRLFIFFIFIVYLL